MAGFPCRRLRQHDAGEAQPFRRLRFPNGFGERIDLVGAGRINEAVRPDDPSGVSFKNEEGQPCPGIHKASPMWAGLSAMAAAMPSGSSHARKHLGFAILGKNEQAWGDFGIVKVGFPKISTMGYPRNASVDIQDLKIGFVFLLREIYR
ncbi:hypothetical protein [Azospirillum palustre]|uniref:hypothetical protein n=1 Tax=Azospirillum palustre TaxID=2044885 RepID=UPI00137A1FB6|nr:hypothetical protein [Azospirillum palustre]